MTPPPYDHFIPRSVLSPWVVPGQGVPWYAADTGELGGHFKLQVTASVRAGNTATAPAGDTVSTEPHWTKYFDDTVGAVIKPFRDADWQSDELATAATDLVPAAAAFAYRGPGYAVDRIDVVMNLQQALQAVGPGATDDQLHQAAAGHLGLPVSIVAELGIPVDELRKVADDPEHADVDALHDSVTGPWENAMIAREQWLIHGRPIAVRVWQAVGVRRFQIGDCVTLCDEKVSDGWRATPDSAIWPEVLSWKDEAVKPAPRGQGRHLRVTFAASPHRLLQAEFAGKRAGKAPALPVAFLDASDDCVTAVNAATFDRSVHWVYGTSEARRPKLARRAGRRDE